MSAVSIPLPIDTPDVSFRVTLDGADYLIRLNYHERNDRWYLDISTIDGTPIASGRKLLSQWSILRGVVDPNRPPGMLFCLNTAGDDPPTFSTLGRSVSLLYVSDQ